MRPRKYFLPPTWPGSCGGWAPIPADLRSYGEPTTTIAKARVAAAEALAEGEKLIEAIRKNIERYAPTKEETDVR